MNLSKIENEENFIKAVKKNPEKFEIIFEQYYEKIFNYVLGRVGVIASAQDITSETFFKAFKNLWRFQWRGISFSAWLYRIANNETKKYFRSSKYSACSLDEFLEKSDFEFPAEYDLVDELKSAEEELDKHQKFLQIQKIISYLPLKYQEILSLRFFEEKKFSEIAQILGKKENTVKSLFFRGLSKINSLIEQNKEEDSQLFWKAGIVKDGRE